MWPRESATSAPPITAASSEATAGQALRSGTLAGRCPAAASCRVSTPGPSSVTVGTGVTRRAWRPPVESVFGPGCADGGTVGRRRQHTLDRLEGTSPGRLTWNKASAGTLASFERVGHSPAEGGNRPADVDMVELVVPGSAQAVAVRRVPLRSAACHEPLILELATRKGLRQQRDGVACPPVHSSTRRLGGGPVRLLQCQRPVCDWSAC
jgi:hypothetical protein